MAAAEAPKESDKPVLKNKGSSNKRKDSVEAQKLDWKFGQRADVSDLVARGIVSEEYEDVLKGKKDASEAEKEHDKSKQDATAKIGKVFEKDLRPSADDVEARGIAPQGSLVAEKGHEYDDAVKKAENEKEMAKKKLAQKFEQRMKPDEAIERHIIDKDALSKVELFLIIVDLKLN